MNFQADPTNATGDLEAFARRFQDDNPFLANAVSDVHGVVIDVPDVHGKQFEQLIGYAEEVHRRRWHMGQVIWGEAGIGKSHLLARFCRWAEGDPGACCIFLHNLQPSPEALSRYVLKCVVNRLAQGRQQDFHGTQLYDLINRTVRHALKTYRPKTSRPTAAEVRECYRRWVDDFVAEHPNAGPDARAVYDVLFALFASAYNAKYYGGDEQVAAAAFRWLSGDAVERDEAASLRMRCPNDADAVVALAGSDAIETVLIVLAQLVRLYHQPLVLCFDQIDNLSIDQFRALTQFLHPLIDHAENLLVLVSGVKTKLLQMVEAGDILGAAWERIAQNEQGIGLDRIGPAQARTILQERLRAFHADCVRWPPSRERLQQDDLFPLGSRWFNDRIEPLPELRPRDAINWAREHWRERQSRLRAVGAAAWLAEWPGPRPTVDPKTPSAGDEAETLRRIDQQAARLVAEQHDRRLHEPEGLPPDAGNLCGLTLRLLERCVGDAWQYGLKSVRIPPADKAGRLPTYHLIAEPRSAAPCPALAITFIATANATSTTFALRRLVNDGATPEHGVLLVTDERLPLHLGTRGHEYLDELLRRGPQRFRLVELTFRDYAALDALQGVIGLAVSGDIEVEVDSSSATYKRVTADEIVASYHRQDCFRRNRLFGKIFAAPLAAGAEPCDGDSPSLGDFR